MNIEELEAQLRAIPAVEPDPEWMRLTKTKLLRLFDQRGTLMDVSRWAIFATYERDPVDFAQWVRGKGNGWRPLAVNPERLHTAVTNLQPNLVVIDPRVPRHLALARTVRSASAAETRIASQHELARTA
ncbi:MAG TPA: hypothetical protein VF157_14895 [Chloroflexota bacterium]